MTFYCWIFTLIFYITSNSQLYEARKAHILKQYLILTLELLCCLWEIEKRKGKGRNGHLGEHAHNIGVQGVLLLQFCVGWNWVLDCNRGFPLSISGESRLSRSELIYIKLLNLTFKSTNSILFHLYSTIEMLFIIH